LLLKSLNEKRPKLVDSAISASAALMKKILKIIAKLAGIEKKLQLIKLAIHGQQEHCVKK